MGGEEAAAKARACGFSAARRWLLDLSSAIRQPCADPEALGPLKEYAELKEDRHLLRAAMEGVRKRYVDVKEMEEGSNK